MVFAGQSWRGKACHRAAAELVVAMARHIPYQEITIPRQVQRCWLLSDELENSMGLMRIARVGSAQGWIATHWRMAAIEIDISGRDVSRNCGKLTLLWTEGAETITEYLITSGDITCTVDLN